MAHMEEDEIENTVAATQSKSMFSAQQPFRCAVCREEFRDAFDLTQHLWVHTVDRPFKCDQCSYSHTSLEKLQNHKLTKHSYKALFKCDQCGTRHKSRRFLLEHQCNKHSVVKQDKHIVNVDREPFKCDQCDNSYKFHYDLLKHQCKKDKVDKSEEEEVTVIEEDGPQQPSTCNEGQLQQDHGNNVTTVPRIQAYTGKHIDIESKRCVKKFPNVTRLEIHQRIHGRKNIQKCGDEFELKSQLISNEKSHTGEHSFQRHKGGAKFAKLKNLNAEKAAIRTKSSFFTFFMCGQCGCKYSTRKELTLHQIENFHIGQKNPPKKGERGNDTGKNNENCGVTAKVSSDMQKTQEQSYKNRCKYCGKTFHGHSHLKQHEMIHTGEKPFICEYCDYSSNSLSNLRAHQGRQHPGESPAPTKRESDPYVARQAPAPQPPTKRKSPKLDTEKRFKCDICDCRFWSKSHLREHTYIHIGRPHKCDVCGRSFNRAIQLERHQQTPCTPFMYVCRYCDQSFSGRTLYVLHLRHHRSNVPSSKPDKDIAHSPNQVKYCCNHCNGKFLDPSSLAIHKCTDGSLNKTWTCKDCGTVVQVGGTTLSNVFTVTDLSNVKCFINNHNLL